MLLPLAALLKTPLQKDRTETLGLSYAGILKLGPARWEELVLKRQGDSTPATAQGFSVYGDALAWRNDGLLKGRPFPLRAHLEAFSAQAQEVGNTATGGGTMWQITVGQCHRDVELTAYRVLTHSYRGPHRVASDVTRSVDRLARVVGRAEGPKDRADAGKAIVALRREATALVALARRLPRRDSDAVLDFCREAALGIEGQARDR